MGRAAGRPTAWSSRIDGDRLCTATNGNPENCLVYPKGKNSGDSFEVTGAQGSATAEIK
jgi:hypothetical protein